MGSVIDRRLRLMRGAGVVYLLRDEFTTAAAAPLASPRTCEPGPGTLTAVQTNGQYSISNGKLNFPAQGPPPAWGQQGLVGPLMARLGGRALVAKINRTGGTYAPFLGWVKTNSPDAEQTESEGFEFADTVSLSFRFGTSGAIVGEYTYGVEYEAAVVQRSVGAVVLVRGGAYPSWAVLWVGNRGSGAAYPSFANYSGIGTLDSLRVADLPAPWDSDYGIATDRKAGSVAAGTAFAHEADCLIEWTQTTVPTGNTYTRIWFRYQDDNNYWQADVNGGTVRLREVSAGVFSQRGSGYGVAAGDRIVVVATGSTIRVYAANVLQIIYGSATALQTQAGGKRGSDLDPAYPEGGTVSDLIAWPRTLSGSARAALEAV